jgi:hypothetical protein
MSDAGIMPLKYADDLSRISDCPPPSAATCERAAFRFVHADPKDPRNFLPVSKLTPQRKFEDDDIRCLSHALSLFDSREHAAAFYKRKKTKYRNFHKTIGTHIAKGALTHGDGVSTVPRWDGHFDFFEAHGVDLSARFVVDGAL